MTRLVIVLLLVSGTPVHAALMDLSVLSRDGSDTSASVAMSAAAGQESWCVSPSVLRIDASAPGAIWKILIHTDNGTGERGLRLASAPESGVDLFWQVYDAMPSEAELASNPPSWALMRDPMESSWSSPLTPLYTIVAAGTDRAALMGSAPTLGRIGSSPFFVPLACRIDTSSQGLFQGCVIADLILLAGPVSGCRLRPFHGAVLAHHPRLEWEPAQGGGRALQGYIIEVDTEGLFRPGRLLLSQRLPAQENSWTWRDATTGRYHWRVLTLDEEGETIVSEPGADSFLVLARQEGPPLASPLPRLHSWIDVGGTALAMTVGRVDTLVFEYRAVPGGNWTPCSLLEPTGSRSGRHSPTRGILWNLSSLSQGWYEVRATSIATGNNDSELLGYAVIRLTENDFEAAGWADQFGGEFIQKELLLRGRSLHAELPDGVLLDIPANALNPRHGHAADTEWVSLTRHDAWPTQIAPPPVSELIPLASYPLLSLDVEGHDAVFDSDVIIGMAAPESWNGSMDRLVIAWFDPQQHCWSLVEPSSYDAPSNRILARVRHFSLFGLFVRAAPPAPTLRNVTVYPNPYIPHDENPANGVPYQPGEEASGITFSGLPDGAEVKIATLAGRSVAMLRPAAGTHSARWDGRTTSGVFAASGVYLALVRAAGETVLKKVMIIR